MYAVWRGNSPSSFFRLRWNAIDQKIRPHTKKPTMSDVMTVPVQNSRIATPSGVIPVGKPKFIVWFHHLLSVWRLQPDNSKPNVPRDIASVALRVRRRPSRCSTITPS